MATIDPDVYETAGSTWNVDPALLRAVTTQESGENPGAIGPPTPYGRAKGIAQFIDSTGRQYGVTDPFNPTDSIFGAAHYISDLLDQNKGDLTKTLLAYNGSSGDPHATYAHAVLNKYDPSWRTGTSSSTASATPVAATTTSSVPPASGSAPALSDDDFIRNLSVPQGTSTPPPPATPPAAAATPPPPPSPRLSDDDFIKNLGPSPASAPPTTQPSPAAAKPGDIDPITGRPYTFLSTAGASPVAATLGKPIVEGQQPGPGTQLKIGLATDPEQRRRIAAAQLFPDLPPNEAQARVFYGDDGRLAAVGEGGKPFYVDPQPVLAGGSGDNLFHSDRAPGTPPSPDVAQPPTLPPGPGASWAQRVQAAMPPGYYGSPSYQPEANAPTAVGVASPFTRGALTGPNLLQTVGQAIPGTAKNALMVGADLAGGPLGIGAASYASDFLRQYAANKFDPQPGGDPYDFGAYTENALVNAAGGYAGRQTGALPLRNPLAGPRVAPRTILGSEAPPLPSDFTTAPYAPGFRAPDAPVGPTSVNPSVLPQSEMRPNALQDPRAATVRPGGPTGPDVQLNPAGDAAKPSGPYAASTPAEINNIPTSLPKVTGLPITSDSGVAARADQIIQHFARGGPTEADTSVNVTGSVPTLAQSTGNAGLATLERAMRNTPEGVNAFAGVDAAQQAARQAHLAKLVGTPDDLNQAIAARDASTSDLRTKAFDPSNTRPTDASPAVAEIDSVLNGPAGKRPAIAAPLQQLRKGFFAADGTPETDPAMLYGVRQSITDALSPLSRGTDADARAASSVLQPVLGKLDAAIEQGAPGYQNYMQAFRDQSGPVNAMQYLQGRNLTDPAGNPTLAKVDATLKDVQRQQAMPGARKADSLSDDQTAQLEALHTDLLRQANLAKGKPIGSNTAQNLATSGASNMLTSGVTHLIEKGVGAGAGYLFGGPAGGLAGWMAGQSAGRALTGWQLSMEQKVRQAVIDRLQDKAGTGVAALQGIAPP